MPRFYFHVCNGSGFTEDDEGSELADLSEARSNAISGLRDIMASELKRGELNLGSFIEIEDEAHELVTVPFADAVNVATIKGAAEIAPGSYNLLTDRVFSVALNSGQGIEPTLRGMWISTVERLARGESWSVGLTMNGDAEYFRRRSVEEKSAAMKAAHPNARDAHLQLALRYDEFASALAASEGALLGFRRSPA